MGTVLHSTLVFHLQVNADSSTVQRLPVDGRLRITMPKSGQMLTSVTLRKPDLSATAQQSAKGAASSAVASATGQTVDLKYANDRSRVKMLTPIKQTGSGLAAADLLSLVQHRTLTKGPSSSVDSASSLSAAEEDKTPNVRDTGSMLSSKLKDQVATRAMFDDSDVPPLE